MEGGGGGGGGWRMIRCGGGGGRGGGEEDKSLIMQQTMLRFRPIAPKPVTTGDAVSSGSKSSVLTAGRTKRKYVRAQRNGGSTRNKNNKEQQITTEGDGGADDRKREVTTLQLLPEKNERANSRDAGSWCELDLTVKKNDNDNDNSNLSSMWSGGGCSDPAVGMQQMRSWVTVECVAGTCMSVVGNGRRCTDAERMRSDLEGDTCPGFISDGMNRVQWVNGAFKRMVTRQSYATEIAVWLVVKETLPYMLSALTCQVKLQYAVEGTEKVSRMVPCDLWRMDGGGFAWRLDVEAALTLGR